ncbi:MAG TPA: cytochrome P450 [Sphingobium sp.]
MDQCPFTPPYPVPHKSKASLFKRFLTGWTSWIHTLFERSYTMKMGEVHLPRLDFYIANELSIVEQVMTDATREFPKHRFLSDFVEPLIGQSVFNTNGKVWDDQRRMINPAFAHTNLKRVYELMSDAVGDMLRHLKAQDDGAIIDIDPVMTHVTADVIFRTMFSVSLDRDEALRIHHAFTRFQRNAQPGAMLHLYGLPSFGFPKRALKASAEIHAVFAPLVRARYDAFQRGERPEKPDILHSLLEARHPETGEPFGFQELIDQIALIFLAGHETSASALSWALYLLSESPDLQETLYGEVVAAAGDGPIGFDHLKGMDGVRNLFRETLRLYPPIGFFARAITRPTVMRDKNLKPGAMIVISPWLIQRNRENFVCPHSFDPDRFTRPEEAEAVKAAYMPFGKGPRICVGAGFAQQEAMLVLAEIIRAFRLVYPKGPKPEPVSRLTLRPKKGVRLELRRR